MGVLSIVLGCVLTSGLPAAESKTTESVLTREISRAVQRGATILLNRQERMDKRGVRGEWPYEGVYRVAGEIPIGYRIGGTSICAWALLEAPGWEEDRKRQSAVGRALDFVLEQLDHPLMSIGFKGGYDVRGWGHTYALIFLLRARELDRIGKQEQEVDDAIRFLIEALEKTEIPETGGWNYSRRRRGGSSPASPFMTAPTIQALSSARRQGEKVSPEVIDRALATLEAARSDNGAFHYAVTRQEGSPRAVAEIPGAIGRMPVCETTLFLAGRGGVDRVRAAVVAFFEHWEWLEKRRRQSGTHVPPYGIAPYYFFYAHYYVAQAIELLPAEERTKHRQRLYDIFFKIREKSGGWNDRVFDRSENFGTAMTMLAMLQPTFQLPPSIPEAKRTKSL